MIDLVLHGASGRMGRGIGARVAAGPDDIRIVERIDCRRLDECRERLEAHPTAVIIDFSTAAAVPALLTLLEGRPNPVVSGTTGLDEAAHVALREHAGRVPVIWAPNMGLGIPLLARLVRETSRLIPDADVAIVETHHRHKRDRPSGTALRLAEAVGRPVEMHSLRLGEVVGDHQVEFAFGGERLTLTHRALTRDVFVDGALAAARFAATARPGLYDMEAVLAGRAVQGS